MKLLGRIIAILLVGVASVLIAQMVIMKLHRRWSGGDYISLYDDDYIHEKPHPHLSSVQRRFRG